MNLKNELEKMKEKILTINPDNKKTETKLVVATLLFIAFLTITLVVNFAFNKKPVVDSLTYGVNGKLDYSVCLKDNEFISKKCFDEDRSFVTSLIENVNVDFKYALNSSNLADYTYNYKIVANVHANEKGDPTKVVYSEDDVLFDESLSKEEINNINLNKQLTVDYQKYNAIITNFKKDYILALDSNVTITATVVITGKRDTIDESINDVRQMSITIPLGEQTANVIHTNNEINNSGSIVQYSDHGIYNAKAFILDVLYKIDVLIAIVLIIVFLKYLPSQKKYEKVLKKTLKNYDQAIVKVTKPPVITDLNKIEIGTFNEMLDARDNLEKPILFYENSRKGTCEFVILTANEAYVMKMNSFDYLEKLK